MEMAVFQDNVLAHDDLGEALELDDGQLITRIFNVDPTPNRYDLDTTHEIGIGDFDGDGRDDVFLATGTAWFYSSGAKTEWDIVPQMQVTLSRLQHVRFNAGARIPVTESSERSTIFLVYFLWDWYDGGLFERW